jgi:ABC-type transport system substrate-binding protein
MREHPFVVIAKLGLLTFLAVILTMTFVAHNETQDKVIRTAQAVDEVKDQVAEVKRTLAQGVRVGGASNASTAEVSTDRTPRTPGWIPLLSPEEEPARSPDDQIDWDAQLRYFLSGEPKGFNLYTSDRDAMVATDIGWYVYGPLAERKTSDKNAFKPYLAEWVEESPDHTEYRVWLRPGVRWHRPTVDLTSEKYAWMKGDHEVTAEDLVFTLDMILDKRADTDATRSAFDDPVAGVAAYKAESKYVFHLRWKKANYFARAVVLSDMQPLPKWIFAFEEDGTPIDEASLGQKFATHWFNKRMCGYGPYAWKEYKAGNYVTIERNEDWWGRRPAFKEILYKLNVKEDEQRHNMFMHRDDRGERDLHFYAIAPVRWKREVLEGGDASPFLDPKQTYINQYQRMFYAYTCWACRSKWFSDKRVRQAMTLAANRAEWMKNILNDIATNPSGPMYVEAPEYDKSIEPWPYDLERAKALLDEAGWKDLDGNGVREKTIDGQKVEFRVKLLDQASPSPELDAVQSDWHQSLRKIGVIVEPDPVEWAEWLKRSRDRKFDLKSAAWRLSDEFQPDTLFHTRLIAIPGSDNTGEWSNARADEVMDALLTEFDPAKRLELFHEFHRIFHEEQPYTITWSWKNPVLHDPHIGGYTIRAFNPQADFRSMWWQKDGPAKYTDGRDKGKGWRRKAGG